MTAVAIPIVTTWRVRVDVRLDAAVNDPQGNTVRDALTDLGHEDVRGVRIGRMIEMTIDAAGPNDARDRVERMCRELLSNPVTESFEIEVVEQG